jgi:hypothetical protein
VAIGGGSGTGKRTEEERREVALGTTSFFRHVGDDELEREWRKQWI